MGALAEITKVFAAHGISLRTVRQVEGVEHARLVLVTHSAREADLAATVDALKDTSIVVAVNSVLRLAGE